MKVALLSVTKSGSNILRNEMGWAGKPRLKQRHNVPDSIRDLKGMMHGRTGDVLGHLRYSDEALELLKDYFIIFQFRDPRAVITSGYAYHLKLYGEVDFEVKMKRTVEHMISMEPWYEHCSLAVRYEHLIEKEYPPTHTYREGDHTWRDEFPSDMLDLYYEISGPIRYWEYGGKP